jgi:hypothetical protein
LFETSDVLIDGVISGVLAALATFALPWARLSYRFVVAAVATLLGFIAWNLIISHAKASGLDVDSPYLSLSWQDVGSGVLAFATTALSLGTIERREPAGMVALTAGVAGVVTMVFDIFVL